MPETSACARSNGEHSAGGGGRGEGKTEWRGGAVRIQNNWSEQLSSKSRLYYYNCRTETSQWQKPAEWTLPDLGPDELQEIIKHRRHQTLLKDRSSASSKQQQQQVKRSRSDESQQPSGDSRLLQRIKESKISLDARQQRFSATSSLLPQQQQQAAAADDMEISPRYGQHQNHHHHSHHSHQQHRKQQQQQQQHQEDHHHHSHHHHHHVVRTPKTLKRKASMEEKRLAASHCSSSPSSSSSATAPSPKGLSEGASSSRGPQASAKASAKQPAETEQPREPWWRPGREYLRPDPLADVSHSQLDSHDLLCFVDHRFVGKFDDRQSQRLIDQADHCASVYNRLSGVLCCELSAELKKLRSLVRIAEMKATVQDHRRLNLRLMQQPQTPSSTNQPLTEAPTRPAPAPEFRVEQQPAPVGDKSAEPPAVCPLACEPPGVLVGDR